MSPARLSFPSSWRCEPNIVADWIERTDVPLDGVFVEIDAAVIVEARQPIEAPEPVADSLTQTPLGIDVSAACLEELVQVIDDLAVALLAIVTALVSGKTADFVLGGTEVSNAAPAIGGLHAISRALRKTRSARVHGKTLGGSAGYAGPARCRP